MQAASELSKEIIWTACHSYRDLCIVNECQATVPEASLLTTSREDTFLVFPDPETEYRLDLSISSPPCHLRTRASCHIRLLEPQLIAHCYVSGILKKF